MRETNSASMVNDDILSPLPRATVVISDAWRNFSLFARTSDAKSDNSRLNIYQCLLFFGAPKLLLDEHKFSHFLLAPALRQIEMR